MKRVVLPLVCAVGVWLTAHAHSAEQKHWEAPPQAASRPNPLKEKPDLAAGGQRLFMRNCAVCHAAGPGQKGPHLSSTIVQEQTDGALFWKITNGNSRTGMPSFSSIPEGQRWQLVLYIRTLRASSLAE